MSTPYFQSIYFILPILIGLFIFLISIHVSGFGRESILIMNS